MPVNRNSVLIIVGVIVGAIAAIIMWMATHSDSPTEPSPTGGGLGGVVTATSTPDSTQTATTSDTPSPKQSKGSPSGQAKVTDDEEAASISATKKILTAQYTYDATKPELAKSLGHDPHAFDGLVTGELKKSTDSMVLNWTDPTWGAEDRFKRLQVPNKMKSTIEFGTAKRGTDGPRLIVIQSFNLSTSVNGVVTPGAVQTKAITFEKVNGQWLAASDEDLQSMPVPLP